MPEPSGIALFCGAALALLVVPGPSVLYIVTRSIDGGRAAGLVSVLGVHTGTLAHIAAAAAGLSALLMSSALAFNAVRYAGAAYLVWLGISRLLDSGEVEDDAVVSERRLWRVYVQAILVNVLNPKTALFFLAFLPQFIDPSMGAAWPQIMFYGALFILLGLLSDGAYALLAAGLAGRLKQSRIFSGGRRWLAGGTLVALGITSAVAGTRPSSA
ncbi:MAG: LysE family translocator [Actinomycetota bacterium]|nr:LysE family translocator [Actinomycetota bacterium]